jgi:hypothetical protein
VTKADEYRRLAQQCLEMASSVSKAEARTALIERANHWQRLADEQQQVVQQQQQQQAPPKKK